MSALFEIIAWLFRDVLLWTVLLPVIWVLATPYILIMAAFRPEKYWAAVLDMYGTVTDFWKDLGSSRPF